MNRNNFTKEQARVFLRNEALKEITAISDFSYFHTQVFCVFAKYGLLSTARQEERLYGDEWSDSDCKDFLLQKIKGFPYHYYQRAGADTYIKESIISQFEQQMRNIFGLQSFKFAKKAVSPSSSSLLNFIGKKP